ncbi:hypothetical protein TrCOL_g7717 [Triparma columacea]|uniref:RAP domain-containing protein n=1 Tax=Triparma columacea TaxID=722753 RepID=A0A9W7LGE1_9STRA|nr:hypothetical protein TrCOL_g7717 [Triparma columacea]
MLRLFSRHTIGLVSSPLRIPTVGFKPHEPLSYLLRHGSSRPQAIEQNKRITEFERSRDWRGLVKYADEKRNEFDDVNWATMWSKLGRMRREARVIKNDKMFNRVRKDFERRVKDDGMGWLGVREVANVVHAYAVMSIRGSAFVEAVESKDVVTKIMREGNPQQIANTIWAMARMGHEAPTLAGAIDSDKVVTYLMRKGNSQDIANIIWAMATLGHEAPTLARAIESEEVVTYLMREGKPQAIANIIWAMARLGHEAPSLARAIESEKVVMKLVSEGKPQNIANTIWAMATLGHKAPTLARAIESKEVVTKLVSEGNSQALANTIWAMATLGHEAPSLARAIDSKEVVTKLMREGTPQAIANTIWAMSKLKYDCPRLVHALAVSGWEIMGSCTGQDISNTAFGLADLGYFNEMIFEQIGKHVNVVIGGSNQHICNTLWAFGISGLIAKHEETVRILWDEAMKRPPTEFKSENWTQLEIARLFARSEGVHLEVVDNDGRGGNRSDMMERAAKTIDNPATRFERDIANDLKRFGFSGFETEVTPFDNREGGNLLKIDIAWKKEKVALELDGPSHFLSPSNERNGPTKAKKRLLKSLGWKVLNMSYLQNMKYGKLSDKNKKETLVDWLKKCGVKPV